MKETVYLSGGKERISRYFPVLQIKKFVAEIENEELRPGEAARKYGVCYDTIKTWLSKYSKTPSTPVKHRVSEDIKKSIVRDIQSGILTREEASKKANVNRHSIRNWLKTYTCSLNQNNMQDNVKPNSELPERDYEVKALKLKVLALETMIDVAENVLKVDIRKKYGTKQS